MLYFFIIWCHVVEGETRMFAKETDLFGRNKQNSRKRVKG